MVEPGPLKKIVLPGREIGPDEPCFVIIEAGVNHNGSLEMALQLVDAAAEAGGDAVKFQKRNLQSLYPPELLDNPNSAEWAFQYILPILKEVELSDDEFRQVKAHCDRRGIRFMCTPWDEASVDFLEEVGVDIYKVASADLINLPLLDKLVATGKPLILSTGMALLEEIECTVRFLKEREADFALLHCVSTYPAPFENLNLRFIETLKQFGVPVGYSSHERGIAMPLVALTLGACIIEKHITLDRTLPGPDHAASLEPHGIGKMLRDIRHAEQALGRPVKELSAMERLNRHVLRKSLAATQAIPAALVAEMSRKSMSASAPILVRIFKQESELEIWKRDRSGRYALLKAYPMCRWSGKLGPKKRDGDRQAPEGFYHVSAGMLNPNSQYYLSFNLGYPNTLEAALGYTGEALMVHGACSSSGCFALTDEGVAEIYAVVREALKGGQGSFQVQAFPFRMTPQNMAKNRNDPNFAFWSDLKLGYDIFEVTRRQPKVSYCAGRYVFDREFEGGEPRGPLTSCPPALNAADPLVAGRQQSDRVAMDDLLSTGSLLSAHAYSDGGMHPSFRKLLERGGQSALAKRTSLTAVPISRPDAALADPYSPDE